MVEASSAVATPSVTASATPGATRAGQARVVVVGTISGLEGARAEALSAAMRRGLNEIGYVAVTTRENRAGALLSAEATLNPPEDGRQRLALIWTLAEPGGAVVGEVRQMSRLRQGALDRGADAVFRGAVEAALPGIVALAPPRP